MAGFASIPSDSPHAAITQEAASWTTWPEGGVDVLVVAVHAPDYEEIEWEPHPDRPARYDLASDYEASHHCDRIPPMDDAAALQATRDLLQDRLQQVANGTDAEGVVRATGAGLHALQDCFSHSDYVDLAPHDQERMMAFLLGNGSAPAVRLVATMPDIDEPGKPADPYPHDLYAKDSAGFNNESSARIGNATKFELARAAATLASARYLNLTLERIPPGLLDEIGDLDPEDGAPAFLVTGPEAVAVLVGTGLLWAALGRRRPT